MKKPSGLAEFAALYEANKPGIKCWTCSIPEVEAINEAKRKGYIEFEGKRIVFRPGMVVGWLREIYGPQVTSNKIGHHFASRHHEKPK